MSTLSELQKALVGQRAETPAEGFKTSQQWARDEGKSLSQTMKIIKGLREAGKVEMKPYKLWTGTRLLPTPHYRLIQTGTQTN